MALRPIDDAIPVTVDRDRVKKQAKAALDIQNKQPDFVKNNENGDRLPATAETTIDYIPSGDLKPLTDPEAKIESLVQGLESKDWTEICDSLNDARRFALYHFTLLLPILETVMLVLVKAMKNPRSALCKTSIMTSTDLFIAYGDKLLQPTASDAFDHLLLQLLLKASQDKRFVCEEAEKALNAMVQSVSTLPLLPKLQTCVSHSNPRVRAKAAISISNCVSKMRPEELNEFGRVSLVQMAAELLNDRLPEAREAARNMVMLLYQSFIGDHEDQKQDSWRNFCQSNLPTLHAQSIVKITIPQETMG
ncbi:hypothetical protein Nepgr_021888 [Nepenthes gracilis]|uniref:TOG domain-containing protein n=1 Tax=Nepenthes gracilis TaxID=150966 RepID=A0AAD3SZR2_NEPGR|nr:hypothetical protein Nepgr_021888 [Nepenthes gracilis]